MKTIDLESREVRRLVAILRERYTRSINLFEISEIKGILQKLGETVDDWTPDASLLGANKLSARDRKELEDLFGK